MSDIIKLEAGSSELKIWRFRAGKLLSRAKLSKKNLILWGTWATALVTATDVDWFNTNLDYSGILFLLYVPLIYLLNIQPRMHFLMTICLISIIPLVKIAPLKLTETLNIVTVLAYYFLVVAVLQNIYKLWKERQKKAVMTTVSKYDK